jgi:hypothetical protein
VSDYENAPLDPPIDETQQALDQAQALANDAQTALRRANSAEHSEHSELEKAATDAIVSLATSTHLIAKALINIERHLHPSTADRLIRRHKK